MAGVANGGSDAVAVNMGAHDEIEVIPFKKEYLNRDWTSSIEGKILFEPGIIKSSSARKSCTMHRVPSWLRRKNSDAYDPKVISIGPLHYEKREGELRAMEEHKWKYLHAIVSRKPEGWLEDCLAAVKGLEKSARNCYSEVIPLDSDSFVEMMVLDGCFILEFLTRGWSRCDDDGGDDAISNLFWLNQAISFDLLLMENQIPFFILKRLFVLIVNPFGPSTSLVASALESLVSNDSTLLTRIEVSNIPIRHLLHLLHTAYVICPGHEYTTPTETPRIDCASKLEERGIKFRKSPKRDAGNPRLLDIRFDKGVIEIPEILVWDKSERENLNLIAFEQCYGAHCLSYITTYYHFMDCLVNTAKDVEILSREGIIVNRLGNDELVASHFNSMVREVSDDLDCCYLSDICQNINKYSERMWPRLRASLVHDYFHSPWATISFLAAVLLLLLTLAQTFFTSFPKFAAKN